MRKCIVRIPAMEWKFRRRQQQHQSERGRRIFCAFEIDLDLSGAPNVESTRGKFGMSIHAREVCDSNSGVDMLEI